MAGLVAPPEDGIDVTLATGNQILRQWVHNSVAFGKRDLLPAVVDHVSGRVIREVLELTGGNRVRAARILGISRPTLLARLKKLRID